MLPVAEITTAASFFQIGITADGIQIPSISNRLNTVEGCSSLVSNDWKIVTNNLSGTGSPLEIPFGTNTFYRLKVQMP